MQHLSEHYKKMCGLSYDVDKLIIESVKVNCPNCKADHGPQYKLAKSINCHKCGQIFNNGYYATADSGMSAGGEEEEFSTDAENFDMDPSDTPLSDDHDHDPTVDELSNVQEPGFDRLDTSLDIMGDDSVSDSADEVQMVNDLTDTLNAVRSKLGMSELKADEGDVDENDIEDIGDVSDEDVDAVADDGSEYQEADVKLPTQRSTEDEEALQYDGQLSKYVQTVKSKLPDRPPFQHLFNMLIDSMHDSKNPSWQHIAKDITPAMLTSLLRATQHQMNSLDKMVKILGNSLGYDTDITLIMTKLQRAFHKGDVTEAAEWQLQQDIQDASTYGTDKAEIPDAGNMKVPVEVKTALADAVKVFKLKGDEAAKTEDASGAMFAAKMLDVLATIQDGLGKTSIDFKKAVSFFSSLKSDLMLQVPVEVSKYLTSGGEAKSLREYFQVAKNGELK